MSSIGELIRDAQRQLQSLSPTPRLEAELLLSQVINRPRAYLHTWPEHSPTSEQLEHFGVLLTRRLRGEPYAYIVGEQEFWSLPLMVSEATLIPRPETEYLVEAALQRIPMRLSCRVIDLGTGSGAIALALASERPLASVTAIDCSAAALSIARTNGRRLGVKGITFRRADWRRGNDLARVIRRRFQFIVTNPPYVERFSRYLAAPELRHEPRSALVSGADGLQAIRHIVAIAPALLVRNGWLMIEHSDRQGRAVRRLLHRYGFRRIAVHRDQAGNRRVSVGQLNLNP